MHPQALDLTLSFIRPLFSHSINGFNLPASFSLDTVIARWGWLGHRCRETWAVHWYSVLSKCPISFSIIRQLRPLIWLIWDKVQGKRNWQVSWCSNWQVRTLHAYPTWKLSLHINSHWLSFFYSPNSDICVWTQTLAPQAQVHQESRDLEDTPMVTDTLENQWNR